MSTLHRSIRALAVVLLMLTGATLTPPNAALAQGASAPEDKAEVALAVARTRYESALQGVRDRVDKAFDAARIDASKAKDPIEAVKAVNEAREAYETRGELPPYPARDQWLRQYAQAARDMAGAYSAAMNAYARAGHARLGAAVTAEADKFTGMWDLAPWGANPLQDRAPAHRTVAPAGAFTVPGTPPREYRLEVVARRTGDSGSLLLSIPLPDARRLSVPLLPGPDGTARSLLTVLEGHVSADLGFARPIDSALAVPGEPPGVAFTAIDGAFEITSVRLKPVVAGKPLDASPRRAEPPAQLPVVAPANPFRQGLKWSGTWDGNGCDIEVVEAGANTALRISRANGAVFRLDGVIRDGVFNLKTVKHVKVARGGVARMFTSQSGKATIRDAKLYVNCTTRNNVRSRKNEVFDIVIDGAEPR